ncbi:Epidermal growth factor-like domain, partial [Quillaja saponaria]
MIVNCLKCEENATSCKTGLCNSNTGTCICNLPDPSTILDGDRVFLGGKFCDEEMTMCDGTNSFWCENGGTC